VLGVPAGHMDFGKAMTAHNLSLPFSEETARSLRAGDTVRLSGIMVTARDAAHAYMVNTLINADRIRDDERPLYEELQQILSGGAIYHCGPVVRALAPKDGGGYGFVAAGPTTSIREEPYEPAVIAHFGVRCIIGKGGMGPSTLRALQDCGAVYVNATGGAASLIANTVKEVVAVHKLDAFGVPEAFWVIRVKEFPAVVTMDSHGESIHSQVEVTSRRALQRLIGRAA
jgi:fumarate hydratase class I